MIKPSVKLVAGKKQAVLSMKDIKSLFHSKGKCKYHIVFTPKYPRQVIYKKIKTDIVIKLRELDERKGMNVVEGECCSNHISMSVKILSHLNVSGLMRGLKSKSSLINSISMEI